MPKRTVPQQFDGDTQTQILEAATRLFALKGFKAVTLREISKAVGIKIASLYYYYSGKDDLIEAVLKRFEAAHKKYGGWLYKANEQASTLDEVLDNLFNEYFITGLDTESRLGMSITLKEQHTSRSAHDAAINYLYHDAIANVQRGFDSLIEKGVIPKSNTKALASLFMLCIMSANDIHIHEAVKTKVPVDRNEIYGNLRILLHSALSHGTLPQAG